MSGLVAAFVALLFGCAETGAEARGSDGGAVDSGRDDAASTDDIARGIATFDLDADGTPETELRLDRCAAREPATCLFADSTLASVGKAEWRLGPGVLSTGLYDFGIHLIGPHFGTLEAIAVAYYDNATARPEIAIVDPNAARGSGPMAHVAAPPGWTAHDTWFGLVRGVGARRYPFLAPGHHYIPRKDGIADWDFLCQFDGDRIANVDPRCGTGFRAAATMFTAGEVAGTPANPDNTFRHNGGFLDDADGDGWDDVHLPYLWVIKIVSGRTGQGLSANVFDVAKTSEPTAPPQFHSGRLYGSFTPVVVRSKPHVLVAAANAVGTFDDVNCNVSRYHAMLERKADASGGLSLAWSRYHSFTKNIFQTPLNPAAPAVTRKGNMLDGCTHRFSDSVFEAGDLPVAVYSRFASETPAHDCMKEQVDEVISNFAREKMEAWTACARENFLPTRGTWSVEVLDLSSGAPLGSTADRYAWGASRRLAPGGGRVFLLDALPGKVRFDRKDSSAPPIVVASLGADAKWRTLASLQVTSRPKIRIDYPSERGPGASTVGATFAGIPELQTRDPDGDGLDDVALEGGGYIGWSERAGGFVVK